MVFYFLLGRWGIDGLMFSLKSLVKFCEFLNSYIHVSIIINYYLGREIQWHWDIVPIGAMIHTQKMIIKQYKTVIYLLSDKTYHHQYIVNE